MPNHVNIRGENEPLDTEDWERAFEPYKGNPGAALMLGFNLYILKAYLAIEPLEIKTAIEALDTGLEALYPYTDFHEKSFTAFLKVVEGELSREEEELLKSLGVKF